MQMRGAESGERRAERTGDYPQQPYGACLELCKALDSTVCGKSVRIVGHRILWTKTKKLNGKRGTFN